MEHPEILIADDESVLLDLYVLTLKQQGIRVSKTFTNGQDLISFMQKKNGTRVVVVDHLMPVKDGLSVVRDVIENGNSKTTYFILVTGDITVIENALDIGVDKVLVKPFRMEALFSAIRDGISVLVS